MREEKKKRSTFLSGILWSSKAIGVNVPNTLIVTYLSFYATDVLGMKASLVATILLLTKLFDGVTDLISGFIVDNTHTKWGKGRPYDICIAFIGVFTVLLFSAPKTGMAVQVIWLAVMYILLQAVFVTLLNTADSVYLLRAFPEERERNNTYSISTIFGQVISITIGVILPVMIASAGTDHAEWTKVVLIVMVPCTIIGMLRFFLIKEVNVEAPSAKTEHKTGIENKKEKKKNADHVGLKDGARAIFQNKYILILALGIFIIVISSGLLNTSAAYYFQYIVGDMNQMAVASLGTYASLIMLVIFVPLANKFGKSNILKFGLVVAVIGNLIRWFGGTNIVTITAGMSMLMFGVMPLTLYFPLYLFDIMDYGEWKTGKRVEGLYAAFPTFANKVASGLSVSLGMFVLGAAGYDGKATVQTDAALNAINLSYNILPTILLIIMTLILIFLYNIDKNMPTVKKELGERRAKAQSEKMQSESLQEV